MQPMPQGRNEYINVTNQIPPIAAQISLTALCLAVGLTGCATPPMPQVHRQAAVLIPSTSPDAEVQAASTSVDTDQAGDARVQSSQPQSSAIPLPANVSPQVATKRPRFYGEAAAFNFSDESIQAVARAVLGEMLKQRYTIAPGVQGTVTLISPNPIPPEEALRLLERALITNGLRLIYSNGSFQILPADQALASGLTAPSPRNGGSGHGYETKLIPLRWISATEMEKLLKPYARPAAIVAVDTNRNQIALAGSQEELGNYLKIIDTFDVDWMATMAVKIIPVPSGRATTLVADLDKIFGQQSGLPTAGLVRFIPLDGSGTVVAIAAQQHVLDDVMTWVDRMDASGGQGTRLYTYDLKFIAAKELAQRLTEVVEHASLAGTSNPTSDSSSPSALESGRAQNDKQITTDAEPRPTQGAGSTAPPSSLDDVGISAMEETNSVLVRASPSAWRSIRNAIARLDVMPLQVHIEAQIAQVQTSGALRYGVSSFFDRAVTDPVNQGGAGLPEVDMPAGWHSIRGSIQPAPQGVGWIFRGRSAAAVIDLLDQVSDVRVLQTPSIFVRNNTEALFNSGSRIPVVSVTLNPNNGGGAYNQVQYLETGTTLRVKPRISKDGSVFLDIEQEVSTPGAVSSADANGNVRIDTNKLKTQVTVRAGDTVMLAGLISDGNERTSSGAPGLARIPVLGGLFGRQSTGSSRDELIMLITASVASDSTEVRDLTDDYLRRFRSLQPIGTSP